jgi:hypothetical protein
VSVSSDGVARLILRGYSLLTVEELLSLDDFQEAVGQGNEQSCNFHSGRICMGANSSCQGEQGDVDNKGVTSSPRSKQCEHQRRR